MKRKLLGYGSGGVGRIAGGGGVVAFAKHSGAGNAGGASLCVHRRGLRRVRLRRGRGGKTTPWPANTRTSPGDKEIEEKDERNVAIANRAKAKALTGCIIFSGR